MDKVRLDFFVGSGVMSLPNSILHRDSRDLGEPFRLLPRSTFISSQILYQNASRSSIFALKFTSTSGL
jgi:hypothetical protein